MAQGKTHPMYVALAQVCRQALAAGRLTEDQARLFFERSFRPLRGTDGSIPGLVRGETLTLTVPGHTGKIVPRGIIFGGGQKILNPFGRGCRHDTKAAIAPSSAGGIGAIEGAGREGRAPARAEIAEGKTTGPAKSRSRGSVAGNC